MEQMWKQKQKTLQTTNQKNLKLQQETIQQHQTQQHQENQK